MSVTSLMSCFTSGFRCYDCFLLTIRLRLSWLAMSCFLRLLDADARPPTRACWPPMLRYLRARFCWTPLPLLAVQLVAGDAFALAGLAISAGSAGAAGRASATSGSSGAGTSAATPSVEAPAAAAASAPPHWQPRLSRPSLLLRMQLPLLQWRLLLLLAPSVR